MRVAVLVDPVSLATRSPSEDLRRTVGAVTRALRARGHEPFVASVHTLKRGVADVVFNLCESIGGDPRREAEAVRRVTRLGMPVTGNPARALAVALDKLAAKRVLSRAGVRVPSSRPGGRAIVKPRREDGSVGIDRDSVVASAALAKRGAGLLVEEYIDGREFQVSLLGGRVLAVSEIDFSRLPAGAPRIVTYAGKWRPRSADFRGTVPVCPARVSPSLSRRLRASALRSARALGTRGPARVDLRVDARGRVYVLEVNPNPDLAPDAGYARAARARGWTYDELVERILRER